MNRYAWSASVFFSRWKNRFRYLTSAPRVYRNWWALAFVKLRTTTIMESREGPRFHVRPQDIGILNESLMLEPYFRNGHVSLPSDGGVIFDVGANMGDFTARAAFACPNSRVIAIEPITAHIRLVQEQISLNQLGNVTLVHAALGSSEGTIDIHLADGGSSAFHGNGQIERARLTTLRRVMDDLRIDRISLLKLDCEGAEWEMLPASEDLLPRIDQICMEFHSNATWTGKRLAGWLTARGYDVRFEDGAWCGLLWARRKEPAPQGQLQLA